jgi:predicted dehydrogenase
MSEQHSERKSGMNDKFRLALIGAGQIGAQSHLPAVLSCADVDLVAIVDAAPGRAAKLARDYGLTIATFTDLEPGIEHADGAIVSTPDHTHCAVATRCLELGIHVLVEKPMTATYAEAAALAALARKTGLTAMVGYVTRHDATVRLLKKLLDQRHFGRVNRFAYQFGTNGGWAPLSGYRTGSEGRDGGVGVLGVTGSHFLDRMLWFWGYPAELQHYDDGVKGPEANCVSRFRYEGPMHGTVRCSKTARLPGGLVLDTEAGRVIHADAEETGLILLPKENPDIRYVLQPRNYRPDPNHDNFRAQVIDFVTACRTGAGFGCNFAQGAESMRLIADLYSKRQPLAQDWYASPDVGGAQ